MKALSQSDYGLIRSLYQDVYAPDIAESILDEFTDEDLDDLTDEYIEEQVTEFFEECLEEGLDIDIVEQTICESVDTELEVLTRRLQIRARVAAMRMRDKTSAASGEGQKVRQRCWCNWLEQNSKYLSKKLEVLLPKRKHRHSQESKVQSRK